MTNNKTRKRSLGKSRIKKTTRTFSNRDYSSGDGFVTKIWGPAAWHLIHTISFNYPVNPTAEDKKNYRNFILSLQNVLPCKYCRINLKKNFKQLPITMKTMKNRDSFSRYVYRLHELVNRMLKKKSGLSFCDVRERYEHFRSRCTEDKKLQLFKFNKTIKREIKEDAKEDKKHKGCTEPLYGKKSKCVIKIVPEEKKQESFQIDEKCVKKRE
jgi:hypothetical protein